MSDTKAPEAPPPKIPDTQPAEEPPAPWLRDRPDRHRGRDDEAPTRRRRADDKSG